MQKDKTNDNIINLDQVREKSEKARQELTHLEKMNFEELTTDNIVELYKQIKNIIDTQERLITHAEQQRELYTGTMQAIEKIEVDLFNQGINVGSYNFDDLD